MSLTKAQITAVRVLQGDLPVCPTPYAEVAAREGLTEEELLEAAKALRAAGVMRRLGAMLRHRNAGVRGNALVAWRPPPERAGEVGEALARFSEVTHCYERPPFPGFEYTLYTMIHGPSEQACEETARRMAEAVGVDEYVILRTRRELKRTSPRYFPDDAG
ncbi:MAG: Lrp/AsnC family transcriptional regulator [Armatimonadota bacterium]